MDGRKAVKSVKTINMSHLAELYIDDEVIRVLEFSFESHKETDVYGIPHSMAMPGRIRLVVETSNKVDFFEWLVNQYHTTLNYKEIEIIVKHPNHQRSSVNIRVSQAICVSCRMVFGDKGHGTKKALMNTELVIAAETIVVNDTTIENPWFRHHRETN